MERELKKRAKAKGFGEKRTGAYVFGTMRKAGWKPSREKSSLQSEVKKRAK